MARNGEPVERGAATAASILGSTFGKLSKKALLPKVTKKQRVQSEERRAHAARSRFAVTGVVSNNLTECFPRRQTAG